MIPLGWPRSPIAFGMALIVAGASVLSWPGDARLGAALPAAAVLGACLGWALDNNLTRKVSLADARPSPA